jgi:hypothetical protein
MTNKDLPDIEDGEMLPFSFKKKEISEEQTKRHWEGVIAGISALLPLEPDLASRRVPGKKT